MFTVHVCLPTTGTRVKRRGASSALVSFQTT